MSVFRIYAFQLGVLLLACAPEKDSPTPETGGASGVAGATGSGGASGPGSGGSDAATPNGGGGARDGGPAEAGSDATDAASNPDGVACSGWSTLQRLSAQALHDLLGTLDPVLINVHCPYAGELPGTDATIYYTNVDAIEAFVGYDHCADIVLTCLGGGMSQQAGSTLVNRGYLRVRDLEGGMTAWQAAGYQLVYRDAGGCP